MDDEAVGLMGQEIFDLFVERDMDGMEAGVVLTQCLANCIRSAPLNIRQEMLETALEAIRAFVETGSA